MARHYSRKFWIYFWLVSIIFLAVFYFFLEFKKNGISNIIEILPLKNDYKAIALSADYLLKKDNVSKTFLVIFQNNMEIRPGGGFIGSFGILKMKNGKVTDIQVHDTSNFDGRIPDTIKPPYPLEEILKLNSWKMRDSNFSPDFQENAFQAEKFYYLGNGQEKFDGVIGITTNVLMSFLKITGPVKLPDYPGTFGDENAVLNLEYQVEKGFDEQGISRGDRKSVMNELGEEILQKIMSAGKYDQIKLAKIILEDLNKKDIQIYFKDENLQASIEKANWGGLIDQTWAKDYLMLNDANLGAWKSDYYIKRNIEYTIDFRQEKTKVNLKINYNHTAQKADWMTKNYLTYLRIYIPTSASLLNFNNFDNPKSGLEFGKRYFAALVPVSINSQKVVELTYELPKNIEEDYALKIQKQAGLNDIPYKIKIISKNGQEKNYEFNLNSDTIID